MTTPGLAEIEKNVQLAKGNCNPDATFAIDPQNGKIKDYGYTQYDDFIADLRSRFKPSEPKGKSDFSVRLGPPLNPVDPFWFRVQAFDLYLTNVSMGSKLTEFGSETDLHVWLRNYPDHLGVEVTVEAIMGALAAVRKALRDGKRPDNASAVTIAAFIISEAARFDPVAKAVQNVLSYRRAINWDILRLMITDWSKISGSQGRVGITRDEVRAYYGDKMSTPGAPELLSYLSAR